MIHPFMDTSKLSDAEIQEKMQKLHTHLAYCERMGNGAMYDNILTVIRDLELEQQKRMSDAMIKEAIKNQKDLEFGDVIDELGIKYDNDEQ